MIVVQLLSPKNAIVVDEGKLMFMVAMGFSEDISRQNLAKAENDLIQAIMLNVSTR